MRDLCSSTLNAELQRKMGRLLEDQREFETPQERSDEEARAVPSGKRPLSSVAHKKSIHFA